jgi:hypothetical protein
LNTTTPKRTGFKLSVRWKLIIPFLLMAGLVVVLLLPVSNRVISNRIEDEADSRLDQTADSVAVLIEQSERQARLSANFIASLPEIVAAGSDARQLETAIVVRQYPRYCK